MSEDTAFGWDHLYDALLTVENIATYGSFEYFDPTGTIYVANGLRGGEIKSQFDPDQDPVDIRGNDIRFDPVTRKFEKIAGVSQHGMTLDDFGNRFLCSNRNPLMHVVIEDHYARRNPNYALPAVVHDVASAGEDSRIYPICRSWTTSLQHAGQFTAACAPTIYRGDALPAEMVGNGFTCDPTGSLVHREVLQKAGATFRSQPAREGVEFLASRDEWFRPVDLCVGPDGALYVVDMYRAVIEHPQWMPDELRKRPDLRYGDDRGRIYRVVAESAKTQKARPQLSIATSHQLVDLLKQANSWHRETAARLLLERADGAPAEALRTLIREAELPAARVAALHVLSGLDLLSQPEVLGALEDSNPGVRQQAVVLAEQWLSNNKSLRREILKLSRDSDPRVRFQVALSLAPMQGHDEIDALKHIALSSAADPWTRRAVAISAADVVTDLLEALLVNNSWLEDGLTSGEKQLIVELTEMAAKTASDEQLQAIVHTLVALQPSQQAEQLQHVTFAALFRRGNLKRFLHALPESDAIREAIRKTFNTAQKLAGNPNAIASRRIEAIALLGYDPESLSVLTQLVFDEPTQAVQLAAIDALANHDELEPWQELLTDFSSHMPVVRSRVLDALVGPAKRAILLLDAIEDGSLSQADIDRVSADQLRRHQDETIHKRANQVLPSAISKDRAAVLADYQLALKLPSDPARGREVFRKQCATCHSVAGVGVQMGPSVGDTYAKTREQLLTDILQPNRVIDSNYAAYLVVTDDGRTFSGLLASENATSITLVQEENKSVALAKSEIEAIHPTGLSLMPDGLEKNIPYQDMSDLLSFLKNWRYLDGLTPYDDDTKED